MDPIQPAGKEPSLDEVRAQFEQWRHSRDKREAIPEALWKAAASLYPAHSLHRISSALRLNHTQLKQRIHEQQAVALPAVPAFIELGISDAATPCECNVEMQHRDGAQMRIQFKGGSRPDLMKLARLFWSRP